MYKIENVGVKHCTLRPRVLKRAVPINLIIGTKLGSFNYVG
jgi:hypothetical protein